MKKVTNKFKIALAFIIGLAVTTTGVYAAATLLSKDISYDNTTSGLTATNLQDAIDETYKKATTNCPTGYKCIELINLTKSASIGDYISMQPDSTSYTISSSLNGDSNQTIDISELNLWRVIRKNNDGTIDIVSENVSSSSVTFKGSTGFYKLVGTLNTIAEQYKNANYVISSRAVGYSSQTENCTSVSSCATDTLYSTDTNLIATAISTLIASTPSGTASSYWLASRVNDYNSSSSLRYLYGRLVNSSGTVAQSSQLYFSGSGTTLNSSGSAKIRPIHTIKSDIEITDGDGSKSNPYVLS